MIIVLRCVIQFVRIYFQCLKIRIRNAFSIQINQPAGCPFCQICHNKLGKAVCHEFCPLHLCGIRCFQGSCLVLIGDHIHDLTDLAAFILFQMEQGNVRIFRSCLLSGFYLFRDHGLFVIHGNCNIPIRFYFVAILIHKFNVISQEAQKIFLLLPCFFL